MSENGARRPGLRALADLATPMAVRVAATLRLADRVEQGLCTAPLLAEATGTHPDALERLLRHLVTVGLFTEKPRGHFALTEYGRQLCEGHEGGRRQWLDTTTAVGRGDLSFVDLEHSVRTGEAAYHVRHGVPFWDDLSADPRLSASFDALMGHHVGYDGDAVVDAYDWGALGHVVDVGGGSGALLRALLKAHPRLEGTLVDLQGPASAPGGRSGTRACPTGRAPWSAASSTPCPPEPEGMCCPRSCTTGPTTPRWRS
ncbi:methyltransferase [Nocardiopsis sp. CNR-923]|uniref:methyltransferase n=1 Tax=Nocardiopsis sp. CNR-923 TaxID=1904965 RepID=UPI000B12F8A4|nr:methyltransferase [Nocardiopsis sp. CNR-923]